MRFEVHVHIEGDSIIEVTATSASEARKIAEALKTEVDILFPPSDTVDDSHFDRAADISVFGVVEMDEESVPTPTPAPEDRR
jgi:hypothetical protein